LTGSIHDSVVAVAVYWLIPEVATVKLLFADSFLWTSPS